MSEPNDVLSRLGYEELLTMVRRLSEGYRTVFNLYAIDGFKHEEIAEKLGISVGTSKSNLFKARAQLQRMIEGSLSSKTS
jgi:DNA-directed RNA polymerase specialized sigma subunit, sigma24 homolog